MPECSSCSCNPSNPWIAIAAPGQALGTIYLSLHTFPNGSKTGELWCGGEYALRQGITGENVLHADGSSHMWQSWFSPWATWLSFLPPAGARSRLFWRISTWQAIFSPTSSTQLAFICTSSDFLSLGITWNQMFSSVSNTPRADLFSRYLVHHS